ncbi:M20/M25/M40 family metallo-hydrolase, partial [Nocardia farcinica]|uniref:M20/M25/M40 family metallo-hydrolase n=1 Tax=Nocardia farcinica TaxID=37329 RepID=UPI0024583C45
MSRSHDLAPVDDATAERLAGALRCATVSGTGERADDSADGEFVRLAAHLEACFPRVHAELELERFGHSRLYRWPGVEPERVSAILLAHQDVVPAGDGWTHPPFAGVVDDGFIWGRGAIDDKSRVLAILEAVEAALAAGVRPRHTVYLAFGHDEEVFGDAGAVLMARRLRDAGVRAELLLDEGGVITEGVADGVWAPGGGMMVGVNGVWAVGVKGGGAGGGPGGGVTPGGGAEGVSTPVASIMVGEKGYATVRLSVRE